MQEVTFVPKELKESADISRGDQSWKRTLITGCKFLIVFAVAYILLGLCANLIATHLPDEWEVRLFAPTHTFLALDPESEPAKDVVRAQAIFSRLSEASDLRALPYRLAVSDMSDPNAFAAGGGLVVVTQGTLDEVESETGLAMVLAHELGHHEHRHVLKRFGRGLLLHCTLTLAAGNTGASDTTMINNAVSLSESAYSRSQETEADEFGLRLVHKVYGHSEGALEFFEKLHAQRGSPNERWLSIFSSHPATEDRIDRLRDLHRELSTPVSE